PMSYRKSPLRAGALGSTRRDLDPPLPTSTSAATKSSPWPPSPSSGTMRRAPRERPPVQSERLTLQELTWLLTQEARSAAEKLRKGVAILAAPDPSTSVHPAPSVEPELEALDDAMQTLASLHTGRSRGQRGRIDLAALLYEVAPNARVSIEPGSGTEVF